MANRLGPYGRKIDPRDSQPSTQVATSEPRPPALLGSKSSPSASPPQPARLRLPARSPLLPPFFFPSPPPASMSSLEREPPLRPPWRSRTVRVDETMTPDWRSTCHGRCSKKEATCPKQQCIVVRFIVKSIISVAISTQI
ncbi:hypothetical protein OsI_33919 [Oryza sativa Indica Group]|uniref:Uncharacterized protein n=1 Tax=Oryza sativa subsp. indica TaxID=39946 RepID=A2Z881_ORYSI|nr:hypothetical protein OsI_33919 [Oryza sativa Indica Group]